MNDEKVLEALLAIETTVNGPDFSAWRKKFVDEHVDKFSYDDENKLEYTEIHQSYEAQIEEHIARGLPKEIPMADFMAALPDYIQGPGGQKEETSRAVTLLLEVSDFTAFREMMLFCKKQKEDAAEGPKDTAGAVGTDSTKVFDVDGLMDMCAKLSESNASQEGWECVLKKDNIVIEKKALAAEERTSKGQIYMRGVVTMDMTYTELVDCFCYFGERRKLWDSNYKGHELPNGGDILVDDELVIKSKLDMGALMHMVGVPRFLMVKFVRRWDEPKKGSVTTAMVPWDVKKNCVDKDNSILGVKITTLLPHPTIPDKSVMTTLEINKMGRMPKWALHLICTLTAPQLMRGLEQRYIANVRKQGKGMDLTTAEARKKASAAEK